MFPYLRKYSSNKLEPRSAPCVFLGYGSQYKGYICFDPSTNRVYITRHAVFDEASFPFTGTPSTSKEAVMVFSDFDESAPLHSSSFTLPTTPPPSSSSPCHICLHDDHGAPFAAPMTPTDHELPLASSPPCPDVPPVTHPMVTRSQTGAPKPRRILDLLASQISSPLVHSLLTIKEPRGFKSAAKNPKW